jgi:hypothetical protein
MNKTDCRAVRRQIDESELGQRLTERLEAHLASCVGCAKFQSERSRLREMVGCLAPVTAPADFDMRLRARIARENAAHARQPFIFRFVMSTPGIALAALTVMMVAGLVWFSQRTPTPSSNTASTNGGKETSMAPVTPPAVQNNQEGSNQTDVVTTNPPDDSKRQSGSRQYSNRVPAFNASRTSDFNSSPAESVRIGQDRAGEVSLSAPVNPMVVTVQDDSGGKRRILLPPISFGSQRMTDNRVPVSMTNGRDW